MKEMEGMVEKDYTIVVYNDNKYDENNKPDYFFNLTQEGTSAKCPPAIFGEGVYKIDNDAKVLLDKILEFVN